MKVNDPIQVEKNGTEYDGNVTEVGSMVNSATGLYDAKAFVNNAESLTSGTKVKLTVVMDQVKGVLTVPVDAVNYDNGKAFVYCYDNGTAKKVMIEAGIYDAQTMEVKSGLTAGDQVITTWSNELVDGQEVLLDSDNEQNENADQEESTAENAGEETQKAGE
jgi:multidrug efflux system membrane fusion protein